MGSSLHGTLYVKEMHWFMTYYCTTKKVQNSKTKKETWINKSSNMDRITQRVHSSNDLFTIYKENELLKVTFRWENNHFMRNWISALNSFTVWIFWWIMHVCFLWLKGFHVLPRRMGQTGFQTEKYSSPETFIVLFPETLSRFTAAHILKAFLLLQS